MTGSIFDGCGDSCGWTAAFISALAYGSFGVPIKETNGIDVHPLILQTYKTLTMFVLSWSVLWMGVKPAWTSWGLISGTLWVLGGTGGIYAIRSAGMAIAVGTWASVMIGVNFVWGILIFQEPVADLWSTMGAFVCLTIGLVGMSRYSAPRPKEKAEVPEVEIARPNSSTYLLEKDERAPRGEAVRSRRGEDQEEVADALFVVLDPRSDKETVELCGIEMTLRFAGILGAVFNGLMTGSSLIPLHYAKEKGFGGANYMISYAGGAVFGNTTLWILFFGWNMVQQAKAAHPGSLVLQAYKSMPEWYLKELWLPGFLAGVLLTIAMFGSILSVTYLGQGIGNSIIQSKILISGLWGICWYKEITGCSVITRWFLAAGLTVAGILWLSQERLSASAPGDDRHRLLLLIS